MSDIVAAVSLTGMMLGFYIVLRCVEILARPGSTTITRVGAVLTIAVCAFCVLGLFLILANALGTI